MTYENLGLRLPEIGRVKIGQKGKEKISTQGNKFQPPEKLDHFRIVTLERGSDNNYVVDAKTHAAIGEDKPKMLPVRFLGKTISENINAGWARYIGTECVCSGDGKTGEQIDRQTGEVTKKACPCENTELKKDPCRMQGKAIFTIEGGRLGGFYSISIKGSTIVPPFIGSLQSLIDICDRAGGSIAGVPVEMHLASYTHKKFGKVYYPRFEYCGDLAAAAKNAHASRFSVLVDDGEGDDDHGYLDGEESEGAQDDAPPAGETKPVEPAKPVDQPKTAAVQKPAKPTAPKAEEKPKTDAAAPKTENAPPPASPALKAFWCDACYKIVNDNIKPGVCKCGGNVWHDAANMKAAQDTITAKIAAKKPEAATKPTIIFTWWCQNCLVKIDSASKPEKCNCDKPHWHTAKNTEEADKAIAAMTGAQNPPADNGDQGMAELKAIRDKKLLMISSSCTLVFGSSTTPAVLKQIGMLLGSPCEGSQYLNDQEVDDLVELFEMIRDMPKTDRDEFISNWKAGRAAADAVEGATI